MAGLSREELADIVPKILSGDQEAFAIFHKEYHRFVWQRTCKYTPRLRRVSMGLYQDEDVNNEFWENIILQLPKYDPERATMTTFMHVICATIFDRLNRYHATQKRNPGEEMTPTSVDMTFGEDNDLSLLSLIEDPVNILEHITSESQLFEHLYFIKKFVSGMKHNYQMVFYHQVKGMTLQESGDILGVTRERVRQIRIMISERRDSMLEKFRETSHRESDSFGTMLFSSLSDDELADKIDCSLAVIKICRELLSMIDLYSPMQEVAV